jgi:predicted metal-binding membrane protein
MMQIMWVRMPGQTWPGAAATFLGMWLVMMAAMMLPSLTPMLWRYRQAVSKSTRTRIGGLTALVGLGYFCIWALIGLLVFPLGAILVMAEMHWSMLAHAIPVLSGVMMVGAGAVQLSAWKARQLACCRRAPGHGRALSASAGSAWRQGLRLGWKCTACCASLTAILLVTGLMDLRAMAVVTAAISAERLLPSGERIARLLGFALIGAGLLVIAVQLST